MSEALREAKKLMGEARPMRGPDKKARSFPGRVTRSGEPRYKLQISCPCGMRLGVEVTWYNFPITQEYHCGTCGRIYTLNTEEKAE